ncbi:MAG TPA: HlyD family type I secretion periplasmic adaptor subunit [Alphaproteobacteria bacterium]
MRTNSQDVAFMSELNAATAVRPPLVSQLFLGLVATIFVTFVGWAAVSHIDEVAVAQGKVVPSSQVQIIQNLEGGIVAEILVKEGDVVEEGQVLLRVDDTTFQSEYRQNRAKQIALAGQIARLTAEVEGTEIEFPASVLSERPDVAANELALFNARRNELSAALEGLRQQVEQRRQEVTTLQSQEQAISRSLALVLKELSISEQLAEKGYRSKLEVLHQQRQANDLEGQLTATRIAIPQAEAALAEAERRLEERRHSHRSQALAELTQRKAEMAQLVETLKAQADRVTRREVRAPVRGLVKQLKVHTIGGVVQPGADLVEIVPVDDQLVVEARVQPADIAFIHPGQKATVKLTAYDYSIYGGLEAELEHISADSMVTERGEPYYLIRVRTKQNYLGTEDKKLAIIPGMIASVDIVTGEKTVLQYLLKPIIKTVDRSLHER